MSVTSNKVEAVFVFCFVKIGRTLTLARVSVITKTVEVFCFVKLGRTLFGRTLALAEDLLSRSSR